MDEPTFGSDTCSNDLTPNAVRGELASTGRALGAWLQSQFSGVHDVSLTLDDVLRTALAEGADAARISADLDMSTDLVDYVARGGTTWAWFLNRALHDIDNNSA